jgi:phospholipase/carboxylesterase
VRIKNDTDLTTFRGWTLRVRPAPGDAPARLLLLLHGLTGDENSMWVFVRNFPERCWMIAPRALHATEPAGYSWRRSQAGNPDRPSLEDLRPAALALIDLVDAYSAQQQIDASQFDVMGFSQGAALTTAIALLYPDRVRKAGILSGFIPAGAELLAQENVFKGKQFFVAHGTADENVKVEYARSSVQILEGAGAHVTYCEDDVGHKVSAKCLRALGDFFSA